MKVMKFLLPAVAFAFATTTFAAAQTTIQSPTSITLKVTVPLMTEFIVTAGTDLIFDLDLTTNITDKLVASVFERTNKRAGYKVTLQTASAVTSLSPLLKGSDAENTDSIPYSLYYGVAGSLVPVSFTGGVALLTDATTKTPKEGYAKILNMNLASLSMFPNADMYMDTLTFTFTAN